MNDLIIGVTLVFLGIIKKVFDIYYEKNLLSKKSTVEQEQYYEIQNKKSIMGAYNTPFSKGNTVHKFNNAIIILGLLFIVLSVWSN